MSFLKTLILGPKKAEPPSPALIKATNRQAQRALDEDKRAKETLQSQFRRAMSSGRNLLISGFKGGSAGKGTGAGAGSGGTRNSVTNALSGQTFSNPRVGGGAGKGGEAPPGGGPNY